MKDDIIAEYSIEFILSGKNIREDKLTKTLTEIGHSVTINKGEGEEFKIHIHSSDPKRVFDRTSKFGKPTYIKVDDLSHHHKVNR